MSEDIYQKTGQTWKWIHEHDKRSQILSKIKCEEEKQLWKKGIQKLWEDIKWSKSYIIGAAERTENEAENIFYKMLAENFLKWMNDKPQIQEMKRTAGRINLK